MQTQLFNKITSRLTSFKSLFKERNMGVIAITGIILGSMSVYLTYIFGPKLNIEIWVLFMAMAFLMLAIFSKSEWLVPLVIIVIPIQATKLLFGINPDWLPETISTGYTRVSMVDFARILMFACIFLWAFYTVKINKLVLYKNKTLVSVAALIAFYFINFLYTPNPSWLLVETIRTIFFFLFMISLIFIVSRKQNLLTILKTFVFSGFAFSLLGIFQYLTGMFFWRTDLTGVNGELRRVSGAMSDPNNFARYLVIWIIFTFAYFLYVRSKSLKTLLVVVLASELLALLFTFSRGGWLTFGIVVVVAVFFLWKYYSRGLGLKIAILLSALAVTLSLMIIFMPAASGIRNSIIKRIDPETLLLKGYTVRGYLLRVGLRMFIDHPIAGVGMMGFVPSLYGPYRDTVPENLELNNGSLIYNPLPQTFLVQVLAETGLVGLVILLSVMFFFYQNVLFVVKNAKNNLYKLFAIALGSSFLAILVASETEGGFYEDPFVWVIIGLVISIWLIVKKESSLKIQPPSSI